VNGDPYVITGANGAYTFANLKPGRYMVGQIIPAGYRKVFPIGKTEYPVSVAAGGYYGGHNFGDVHS